MAHLVKLANGHLVKNAAGHLANDCGAPAVGCGYCYNESQKCYVTISGASGSSGFLCGYDVGVVNGTWELAFYLSGGGPFSCGYAGSFNVDGHAIDISMYCYNCLAENQQWTEFLVSLGMCCQWSNDPEHNISEYLTCLEGHGPTGSFQAPASTYGGPWYCPFSTLNVTVSE
jgi:hypothetical protein